MCILKIFEKKIILKTNATISNVTKSKTQNTAIVCAIKKFFSIINRLKLLRGMLKGLVISSEITNTVHFKWWEWIQRSGIEYKKNSWIKHGKKIVKNHPFSTFRVSLFFVPIKFSYKTIMSLYLQELDAFIWNRLKNFEDSYCSSLI